MGIGPSKPYKLYIAFLQLLPDLSGSLFLVIIPQTMFFNEIHHTRPNATAT
jgi:hypothetical protein